MDTTNLLDWIKAELDKAQVQIKEARACKDGDVLKAREDLQYWSGRRDALEDMREQLR